MIETRDIRVDYADVTAVTDVSLSISKGQVYGLIGPNGAGKTSLIRVLATLQEPTYGEIRIAGFDVTRSLPEARRAIGYMPDMAPVYKDLKCWEFLDLFARAYFVSRRERMARIESCIDEVNLRTKRDSIAGTLSRGMTQRLVLAKTLLHDPAVLLLDEPASGLDPIARVELRRLMSRLGQAGRTILISSHHISELSEFCTMIGVMERGKLLLDGPIETIVARNELTRRFTVETVGDASVALASLQDIEGVVALESHNGRCTFESAATDEDVARILSNLVRTGVPVKAFYERRRGVEDLLIDLGASEVS